MRRATETFDRLIEAGASSKLATRFRNAPEQEVQKLIHRMRALKQEALQDMADPEEGYCGCPHDYEGEFTLESASIDMDNDGNLILTLF